jgi:hypothetical protein
MSSSAALPLPVDGDSRLSAGHPGGWLDDATEAWFAVWTRSRHESAVEQQLARKGIEAFLPTMPRWSRWKDRRKKIDWPLFPGYCFAHISASAARAVLTCPGVVTLVSFEGKPLSMCGHLAMNPITVRCAERGERCGVRPAMRWISPVC